MKPLSILFIYYCMFYFIIHHHSYSLKQMQLHPVNNIILTYKKNITNNHHQKPFLLLLNKNPTPTNIELANKNNTDFLSFSDIFNASASFLYG